MFDTHTRFDMCPRASKSLDLISNQRNKLVHALNLSINGTVDIQIASCSTNFQIENAERLKKNKT